MQEIYGGLFLENLVAQDRYFAFQAELFERGIIQGIQMRVAHPSFTPEVAADALPAILNRLPFGCPIFVHFGAENVGVDFGETLDECAMYAQRGRANGQPWAQWNRDTIAWGYAVAAAARMRPAHCPVGVVHPGYGTVVEDRPAFLRVVGAFQALDDGARIAIENVPPLVHRAWYEAESGARVTWDRERYWGFGGTPSDMAALLGELGDGWRCLIDFTHLRVATTQASIEGRDPLLTDLRVLDRAVDAYLALPHWPICHFSGNPPTRMDHHGHIDGPVLEPLRDGLRQMAIICLEVPWRREDAEQMVASFRARYLDGIVTV